MSLASTPQASNVRQLLGGLDEEDLLSLAHTATNNRILPQSKKEAIDVILIHTPDLGRLFSYRKITSQVLFGYLTSQNVTVNAQYSKIKYASVVQEYWEKKGKKIQPSKDPLQKKSHLTKAGDQYQTSSKTNSPSNINIQVNNVMINPMGHTNSGTGGLFVDVKLQGTSNQHPSSGGIIKSDEFTRHFCNWYYTMVNRLQPVCAHIAGDTLREEIFCSNCSAEVYLIGATSTERFAKGHTACSTLLKDTFTELRLLFNPNVENGVQAFSSSHGLVKVMVCGTLHQDNSLVGVFEQEFGLARSPVDKTWKIMYTKLNLKQAVPSAPPTLPKCQVFEITM